MKFKVSLLMTAVAIVAVGCGQSSDVVKIGHVGPVSGAIAHLGKDNENGARMAIDELNEKGVTIGGKKVKFELVAEDDAADPKQGTAAAQKLVDSKVNGVIGHLNSGTTIPASKLYNDAGIGKDEAGVSRLPALDQRGIAAATVSAATARIGDARSTYEDGIISRVNARAASLGLREGMTARAWVDTLRKALAR